jgi:ketosteroid isomerase-like protein
MQQDNVDIVRRALAHFEATGDHLAEVYAPEFVWDMTEYRAWLEAPTYEGIEGLRRILSEWGKVFDWEYEVESIHDAGDRVVTIVAQRGRPRSEGVQVEMRNGLVWALRGGKITRVVNYYDPREALRAAGLADGSTDA